MKKKFEAIIENLPIDTDPGLPVCVMVSYFMESESEYLVGMASEMPNALRELLEDDVPDMPECDQELLEYLSKCDGISIEWIDINL